MDELKTALYKFMHDREKSDNVISAILSIIEKLPDADKKLIDELSDFFRQCNPKIKGGRHKKIAYEEVQRLKTAGETQEKVAQKLNVSISTVKRQWK